MSGSWASAWRSDSPVGKLAFRENLHAREGLYRQIDAERLPHSIKRESGTNGKHVSSSHCADMEGFMSWLSRAGCPAQPHWARAAARRATRLASAMMVRMGGLPIERGSRLASAIYNVLDTMMLMKALFANAAENRFLIIATNWNNNN